MRSKPCTMYWGSDEEQGIIYGEKIEEPHEANVVVYDFLLLSIIDSRGKSHGCDLWATFSVIQ